MTTRAVPFVDDSSTSALAQALVEWKRGDAAAQVVAERALEAGANPNSKTYFSGRAVTTAMVFASKRGREDMIALLGQYGGVLEPESVVIVIKEFSERFADLLNDFDPRAKLRCQREQQQAGQMMRAIAGCSTIPWQAGFSFERDYGGGGSRTIESITCEEAFLRYLPGVRELIEGDALLRITAPAPKRAGPGTRL